MQTIIWFINFMLSIGCAAMALYFVSHSALNQSGSAMTTSTRDSSNRLSLENR